MRLAKTSAEPNASAAAQARVEQIRRRSRSHDGPDPATVDAAAEHSSIALRVAQGSVFHEAECFREKLNRRGMLRGSLLCAERRMTPTGERPNPQRMSAVADSDALTLLSGS